MGGARIRRFLRAVACLSCGAMRAGYRLLLCSECVRDKHAPFRLVSVNYPFFPSELVRERVIVSNRNIAVPVDPCVPIMMLPPGSIGDGSKHRANGFPLQHASEVFHDRVIGFCPAFVASDIDDG